MKKLYFILFSAIFICLFNISSFASNYDISHYESTKIDSVVTSSTQVIPGNFNLFQNYPNPFNPTTEIKYSLPEKSHVVLKVYNALGKEVASLVDEVEPAGIYKVTFDGKDLFSGVYFYRFHANDYIKVRKMILLK